MDENTVYLEFDVSEPQLNNVTITGIRRGQSKTLKSEAELKKGAMVTDNLIVTTKNYFKKKYTDKGFLKAKVTVNTAIDSADINVVNMRVFIDKGEKIKINNITFDGNSALPSAKLRGSMSKTKKSFLDVFGKVLNILKKTSGKILKRSLNDIVDLVSETPEF